MKTQITRVFCDLCEADQLGVPRCIFGVDICDGCFAARAGETLDLLAKRSVEAEAEAKRSNSPGHVLGYYGYQGGQGFGQ